MSNMLFRQVHPSFIVEDKISSQVFKPTPKDEGFLSCYNSDLISAEDCFHHYTQVQNLSSAGVVSILESECLSQDLAVRHDGTPFPEHSSIDYSPYAESVRKKKAQQLSKMSRQRGYLFLPK